MQHIPHFYIHLIIIYICLIIFAGFPPTTTLAGTSFTTTAPAATTELSPIVTPGAITQLPPSHTLFPIVTGLPYSKPDILRSTSSGCVAV